MSFVHPSVCPFCLCRPSVMVHPSVVCSLTPISPATISLYLVQVCVSLRLGTNVHHVNRHCWKGFRGQRSRSLFFIITAELYYYNSHSYSLEGAISRVQIRECCNGRGILFDNVTSRLTCLFLFWISYNNLLSCHLVFMLFVCGKVTTAVLVAVNVILKVVIVASKQ